MSKASKKFIHIKEGVNVFIRKKFNSQTYDDFNAMLTPCFEFQKLAKIHTYKKGVNVFIRKKNIHVYDVFNAMLTPCFQCQKLAKNTNQKQGSMSLL